MSLRPAVTLSTLAVFGAVAGTAVAVPVVREGAGANPASIQGVVDQFRLDLGNPNNGNTPGSQPTGRREVNWDAAAGLDAFASPALMPADFFNNQAKRGSVFTSPDGQGVLVSQRNGIDGPVRFGDIDASYTATFQTFSAERLFAAKGGIVTEATFFVPGTTIPATVRGFGAVFADVDLAGATFIELFDDANQLILSRSVGVANNGLSFLGISFDDSTRIGKVRITTGNAPLAKGNVDGFFDGIGTRDLVAMDDFFYAEPVAIPTPATAVLSLGALAIAASRRRRV